MVTTQDINVLFALRFDGCDCNAIASTWITIWDWGYVLEERRVRRRN